MIKMVVVVLLAKMVVAMAVEVAVAKTTTNPKPGFDAEPVSDPTNMEHLQLLITSTTPCEDSNEKTMRCIILHRTAHIGTLPAKQYHRRITNSFGFLAC